MKEITVKVPENKLEFFMELLDQLDFEAIGRDFDIPEWQQQMTLNRLKELDENPDSTIDFDKMINHLESKYGL